MPRDIGRPEIGHPDEHDAEDQGDDPDQHGASGIDAGGS